MNIQNEQDSTKVASRWTPAIIERGGFTPVANLFLRRYAELKVRPGEAMLIIHMMCFRWDHKPVQVATSLLARDMGLSQSQIRVKLKRLQKLGLIEREDIAGEASRFKFDGLLVKLCQLPQKTKSDEDDVETYWNRIQQKAGLEIDPKERLGEDLNY